MSHETPKNMQDGSLFLGVVWSVCHLDRPNKNPIGDPDMAHLPQDNQKCPKWQTSVRMMQVLNE